MGLGRRDRYKPIYQTLGVAGHKNFRSGGDFMKEAASRPTRDMVYDDEWLGRDDDHKKVTTPARDNQKPQISKKLWIEELVNVGRGNCRYGIA